MDATSLRTSIVKHGAALFTAVAVTLTVAACGSSDDASSSTSATAGGGGESAELARFNARVDRLVAEASEPQRPNVPTEGVEPAAGERIVIVSCSQQAEGCRRNSAAAAEAARVAGWTSSTVDAAGDVTKMASGIRQAVDTRAAGAMVAGVDTAFIPDVLRQAKDAGLGLVCWVCGNEPRLYDDVVTSPETYDDDGWLASAAAYRMQGYRLRMLMMEENAFAIDRLRGVGARRFVADCQAAGGDCELLGSAEFTLNDMTTSAPQKAVNLVRTHPDANVLWSAFDAAASFQFQAVRQAGLEGDMIGVGFDANAANLDDIRSGGFQRITVGQPAKASGFAFVDNLIRVSQGRPAVEQGIRVKLLTEDNVPEEGAWEGDFEAEPLYRRLWSR